MGIVRDNEIYVSKEKQPWTIYIEYIYDNTPVTALWVSKSRGDDRNLWQLMTKK